MHTPRASSSARANAIPGTVLRYAFAVSAVVVAFALKVLLHPLTGTGAPFVLFFGAVVVASLWAGTGPGVVATLLSLPLGAYIFVMRAGYTLPQAATQGALFLVDGFVVVYLSFVLNRARRAAESSERRLRLANEAAAIASWELDVPSGRLLWSREPGGGAWRPEAEPRSLSAWLALVHPDDRDAFQRAHQRSLDPAGDGAVHCEVRVVAPDGVARWLTWSGRIFPVDRRDGRALRQVGTAIDVTERRQREESLRRVTEELSSSEARQRDLLELAPEAFFLADMEGRFGDVNQAACRLLGYEREALLGKRIADIIPPAELPRLEASRSAMLVPGHIDRSEWDLIRSDGLPVSVEVSAKILSGGRWQAFVRDIGERKRAEEALKASEEDQRLLADVGAALATSLDFEQTLTTLGQLMIRDLADWCVIDVVEDDEVPRRLKVAGARPEQALLATRLETLRLDRRRPHLASSVLETRRPFLKERVTPEMLVSLTQSEEHLQVLRAVDPQSIMGLPLLIRGELRGVLILISSTPSRLYGPRDLRRAEALAERAALAIENGRLYRTAMNATQFRDEILGIVAHDLRNPVAAIMMQAESLRRRTPESERRNQKPAERILRAAQRMNRLIGDLLDVTRIESGQLGVEQAQVSAHQIAVDAIEAQRQLVASASLALRVELADDLPEVWGDQHRLLQVLENLIGNAIKFTPADGRITVGAAPRGREVLFWVADTGLGISPEGLPHVFDRFWQARKGHGAGLGLPIARGIIEAHGGRIWVESTLGRGTVVFFTVPEAPPAEWHRQALH